MKMDNNLRREFVKNYNLHIQLVQEPYLSHSIEVLDPFYQTKEKWAKWQTYVDTLKDADEHFSNYRKLQNTIIDWFKANPEYQAFNAMDMKAFHVDKKPEKQKLYMSENAGKEFWSLDLREANFQALQYVMPSLENYSGFSHWISQYTKLEVFLESKNLRQVILGNLNPARQATIQKYLMNKLYCELLDLGVKDENIQSVSNDELIYSSDREFLFDPHMASLQQFKLVQLGNFDFYVKEMSDGTQKVKNIPAVNLLDCVKHYTNQELHEYDLCFYFEKRVASFHKSLFVKE